MAKRKQTLDPWQKRALKTMGTQVFYAKLAESEIQITESTVNTGNYELWHKYPGDTAWRAQAGLMDMPKDAAYRVFIGQVQQDAENQSLNCKYIWVP